MTPAIQRVNRDNLINYLKEMIEKSDSSEIEVSSAQIARDFNVSPATIDHHLRKLESEGQIVVSNKRGKHNRKIYRLPSSLDEKKETKVITPIDDENILKKLLQAKENALNSPLVNKDTDSVIQAHGTFTKKEPVIENRVQVDNSSDYKQNEADKAENLTLTTNYDRIIDDQFMKDIESREKSLDDQIRDFQARNQVTSADVMLKKDDREILSVAVESLNQFSMFFKDLTEQLSTLEDKRFIQALIEERNQNLETITQLQNEVSNLTKAVNEVKSSFGNQHDRETRAKLMIQRILHTLDSYVEQPSHTLFLERNEFRKNMTKEIMDLYRFATNTE